jgi:translation initiation factor IF-2
VVAEKCDAANVSIEDIFRTNVLALEHIVQEPETQIAGLTVIVDMNGFGFQHAKFLSPYYARRTVEVIQVTATLSFVSNELESIENSRVKNVSSRNECMQM